MNCVYESQVDFGVEHTSVMVLPDDKAGKQDPEILDFPYGETTAEITNNNYIVVHSRPYISICSTSLDGAHGLTMHAGSVRHLARLQLGLCCGIHRLSNAGSPAAALGFSCPSQDMRIWRRDTTLHVFNDVCSRVHTEVLMSLVSLLSLLGNIF